MRTHVNVFLRARSQCHPHGLTRVTGMMNEGSRHCSVQDTSCTVHLAPHRVDSSGAASLAGSGLPHGSRRRRSRPFAAHLAFHAWPPITSTHRSRGPLSRSRFCIGRWRARFATCGCCRGLDLAGETQTSCHTYVPTAGTEVALGAPRRGPQRGTGDGSPLPRRWHSDVHRSGGGPAGDHGGSRGRAQVFL